MKRIETVIDIASPPERVWELLTDFPSFLQWNPFITWISGPVRVGAKLSVHVAPPGAKGMTFAPKVLVADPSHELRWRGCLGVPGLFDGEHSFRLDRTDFGTRFHQAEDFSGLLVLMMPASAMSRIKEGFAEMNHALKRRAEAHANS